MTTYFANPGDDLVAKVNALVPGDTLSLNDGTYQVTSANHGLRINGVNGTVIAPIVIKATNDGQAIIDGMAGANGNYQPIYITNSSYITLQGLVAKNSYGDVILLYGETAGGGNGPVNQIILQRITAHGAGNQNFHCFDIQTADAETSPKVTNVLVEDCAAWGPGRYMFIAFASDFVTFRRCYAYWNTITDTIQQPRACFSVYGTTNCSLENCIGRNAIPYQTEAFNNYFNALWHTSSTHRVSNNVTLRGCAFYDNWDGYWINNDAGGNLLIQDCYFETPANANTWTNKNKGDAFVVNATYLGSAIIKNCTFRNSVVGLNKLDTAASTLTISNNAFIGNTTAMANDPGHDHCGFFGNGALGTTTVGTDLTSDPGYDTATYGRGAAMFVKASSPYKGAGSGGANIGATILYQYKNGSITGDLLWPWPMEARIVAELGQSPTYETSGDGGPWKTLQGVYPRFSMFAM
jgi:hypothetical protein